MLYLRSSAFRQPDRLSDPPKGFLKGVSVILGRDRHVIEQIAVCEKRRVDDDAFLAAERRRVDEWRRERRTLGDLHGLMRPGEAQLGVALRDRLQPGFCRLLQIARA